MYLKTCEEFFDKSEMCLSPFSIPNPNYHSTNPIIQATKDCESQMIAIPCGRCPQCIALKQLELVQRIQMESLEHHLFFTTLTYNNEYLPIFKTSVGDIPFADFMDIDLLMKRLRNDNAFSRPFRYIAVSERGGKNHRPHFHILWILPKHPDDKFNDCLNLESILRPAILSRWARNFGSKRKPLYKPLTNFQSRFYAGKIHTNYDTHYVNPSLSTNGVSDAAFYVLKYMLKASPYERYLYAHLRSKLDPSEFYEAYPVIRSHRTSSKGIGCPSSPVVRSYIESCIKRSDKSLGYPQYFSPDTGKSFPMCKYYRTKFLDLYQAYDFAYSCDFDYDQMSSDQKILAFKRFDKVLSQVQEHETQIFYDL